ncbi:CSPP1 [Acanthosepion pharaonis]|uniref:CSPP1 n=1 Tax=Acanthosepion pharaonis TaxID=158019 RepID=A0A812D1B1_ACAPH|nr:CSPP1 [Sepia pharaonis]
MLTVLHIANNKTLTTTTGNLSLFIREQKSKLVNERSNLGLLFTSDESPSIWKLGQYENHRKKLQEERHNEYKNYLQSKESFKSEQNPVKSKPQEERKIQNIEQQLRELHEKSNGTLLVDKERPQNSVPSSLSKKKQPKKEEQNDFFANLGEYENKKKKLKEERERDYRNHLAEFTKRTQPRDENDFFLRNKPTKAVENISKDESLLTNNKPLSSRENHIMWADQAYEDRAAPPLYRSADYNSDYPLSRSKTSASEKAVNHYDMDLKDLANEYSARLSQPNLHEEIENRLRPSSLPPVSNNIFEDPLWSRLRENPQKIGPSSARSTLMMPEDYMKSALNNEERKSHGPHHSGNQHFIKDPVLTHANKLPENKTETYATLPIGNNQDGTKQRQKHNYREELQKQIRERNEMRLREKQLAQQFPYDANLIFPSEKQNPYPLPPQPPPPPEFEMDHLRLFDGQNNSVDKAYTFYGMKSHFDDLPPAADIGLLTPPLKKIAETNYVPRTSYSTGPNQKNTAKFGPSAMVFGNDDSRLTARKRDQEYMKELEKQMQEKKIQKLKAKQEQERYDKRLEEENKQYNPFGRGGGGAPLKDSSGNILANLYQIKQNDVQLASFDQNMSQAAAKIQQGQQLDTDNFLATLPDLNEEPTHARGGHGIFGQPKTDAQKTAMDKYREELQKQMIDKRKQKLAEAERERLEEEKVNKRLEEERKKMQAEFEEEERKKKAKLEEEKKAEAEMRRQIEEKRKAAEKQRKEEDEKFQNEKMQQEKIRNNVPQVVTNRPKSPPVPALQRKINSESRANSVRQESPPQLITSQSPNTHEINRVKIHEESKPPVSPKFRAQSADVLNQLKVLRKGLQQKFLESEMRRHSAAQLLEPPNDVLINQKAVLLRRGSHTTVEPPTSTNPDVLQDFNQLKYRKQTGSRNAFRTQFPNSPVDLDSLEIQQRALINHQEKTLQKIRQKAPFRGNNEIEHPPLIRQKTVSPQPMLDSKSAFFDADSMPLLSDMFSDKRIQKTDSARSRRRRRLQSPLLSPLDNVSLRSNSVGSIVSLNPDKIARKNEARLKKLQNMTDAVSITEPEEILDRFMAKQDHNSPPSSLFDGFNY